MQTKAVIWQQTKWDETIHNDYNEQWIKWITIMMQTTTITINNEQCQWTIISTTMKNENYVLQCLTKFVMKILL